MVGETLVRHPDGSYLLMQRDRNKKVYPGYLGIGAGRSVLKGESAYKGAVRKLWEETGIHCHDLEFLFACSSRGNTFFYHLSLTSLRMLLCCKKAKSLPTAGSAGRNFSAFSMVMRQFQLKSSAGNLIWIRYKPVFPIIFSNIEYIYFTYLPKSIIIEVSAL